mgnify:CR=1 FL=1
MLTLAIAFMFLGERVEAGTDSKWFAFGCVAPAPMIVSFAVMRSFRNSRSTKSILKDLSITFFSVPVLLLAVANLSIVTILYYSKIDDLSVAAALVFLTLP